MRISWYLTQVSVVSVRLEQHLRAVYEETEWQEDFNIGSFLQDGGVDVSRVFQLTDANRVVSGYVTPCIQWVHHLNS